VQFQSRCNLSMVGLEPLLSGVEQELRVARALWHAAVRGSGGETDEAILRRLLEAHFRYTGSFRAKAILHDWINARSHFVKVMPSEYKRALGEAHQRAVLQSTEKATA
jgi:glutamate synthase (NADPH/NADH) large chain